MIYPKGKPKVFAPPEPAVAAGSTIAEESPADSSDSESISSCSGTPLPTFTPAGEGSSVTTDPYEIHKQAKVSAVRPVAKHPFVKTTRSRTTSWQQLSLPQLLKHKSGLLVHQKVVDDKLNERLVAENDPEKHAQNKQDDLKRSFSKYPSAPRSLVPSRAVAMYAHRIEEHLVEVSELIRARRSLGPAFRW